MAKSVKYRNPKVVYGPEPGSGIDWDEALRLHEEERLSYRRIAERFGYSWKTVQAELSARGARPHPLRLRGKRDLILWSLWREVRAKCNRPSHRSYRQFGARGIRLCAEWERYEPFRAWARASGWRPGLRLVTRQRGQDFTPETCQWVTERAELQSREVGERTGGRGKPKPRIDWDGVKRLLIDQGMSRAQIAKHLGAHYNTICNGLAKRGIEEPPRKRGPTSTPEGYRIHKTWYRLISFCTDPEEPVYKLYGARGARVCREWTEFEPFLRWALASGCKPGLCLTRIDRSKAYSPANCEWVTRQEIYRRRRLPGKVERGRLFIEAFGETHSLAEWSRDRRCQVTAATLRRRLRAGMDPAEAIAWPSKNRGSHDTPRTELEAFGVTKGLTDWSRDPRCRVGATAILKRLEKGWTAEDAIRTRPYREPEDRP